MTSQAGTLFVFVNLNNPATCHNLQVTRSIYSSAYQQAIAELSFRNQYLQGDVAYLPYVPNQDRSYSGFSFYSFNAVNHYRVEYDAEVFRGTHCSTAPSRLSAVYGFEHLDDCRKAHALYGWELESIREFRIRKDSLTRVARVNMEVIALMRNVYPRAAWDQELIDHIWSHYWNGKGSLNVEIPVIEKGQIVRQSFFSGEIWEYLIEGQLELVGSLDDPPTGISTPE